MMMNRTLPAAFLLIFLLAFPGVGLTLRPTHFNTLRGSADHVVAGTVRSLTSECNAEPGSHGVRTRMVLEQIELLASKSPATNNAIAGPLDVILPGGTIDGRTVSIPGAPRFAIGERVVLFLRDESSEHFIAGHGLGVLRRSADGLTLKPDITSEGGTPAAGEPFAAFVQRLASPTPEKLSDTAISTEPAAAMHWPALSAVALFLLSAALIRARHYVAALGAGAAGIALLIFSGSSASAETVAARSTFVASGDRWTLRAPLRGRVDRGEVLWVMGGGTDDLTDEVAFGTINRTFQQWEDLPQSSIAFRQDGVTIERGSVIDERNVISFLNRVPRDSFDSFTLAVTFLISDSETRELVDTDIVFNDRDVTWVVDQSEISLEAVSLHEVGHFLGLDHSNETNDVMFPTAGGLTILSAGDRAGAEFLYPVDPAAPPVALATASPMAGSAPLNVSFFSAGTHSNPGSTVLFLWDFGDGSLPSTEIAPQHLYEVPGTYTAMLTVSDVDGRTDTDSVVITVGMPGAPLNIVKLGFAVQLFEPLAFRRGKDKLSLTVTGPELLPGDGLILKFRNTELGANLNEMSIEAKPILLDLNSKFRGDGNVLGRVSVRYMPRNKQTVITYASGFFGQDFDPRDLNDTRQLGSFDYPLMLRVDRAGSVITHSGVAPVDFKISSGRVRSGFIEKKITGKLKQ